MAVQVGIDLFQVQRMERALERADPVYFSDIFTRREYETGQSSDRPAVWFAQRFALKEAAFKSLCTAWAEEMAWNQIEVLTTDCGGPAIALAGAMKETADRAGIVRFSASVSSDGGFAAAIVTAEIP